MIELYQLKTLDGKHHYSVPDNPEARDFTFSEVLRIIQMYVNVPSNWNVHHIGTGKVLDALAFSNFAFNTPDFTEKRTLERFESIRDDLSSLRRKL